MNKVEKQLNFLEFHNHQYKDGKEVIEKRIADKKKEEYEKGMKEIEDAQAAEKKAKYRKERLNELAKPKDKWKVGKKLLEMQKKFPHDRVL